MTDTKSLLMGAVPGAALAIMLVLAVPGSALVGTQVTTDGVGAHGYVTVSVVRDGQEIYHHEDHNAITNAGLSLIQSRIFDPEDETTLSGTNKALYIALAEDSEQVVDATQTTLTGEITEDGLERALGSYSFNSGTNQVTIQETFIAEDDFVDVNRAGLFNAALVGTMFAINSFTPVTLAENDQLTITWTITLSQPS